MIGQFLNAIWSFFKNLFWEVQQFLSQLFSSLFQTLFWFLKMLLRPVFIVVAIIFYVIYKVALLAVTLLKVFLAIAKLLVMFIKGIFVTLAGFTFTPTARNDGSWTSVFNNLAGNLGFFQLDTLAYVLQFCIWFGTAFAVISIISSMGGGED